MRGEVAVAWVPAAQQPWASAHHESQVADRRVGLEAHGALRGDLWLRDELVPRRQEQPVRLPLRAEQLDHS